MCAHTLSKVKSYCYVYIVVLCKFFEEFRDIRPSFYYTKILTNTN